MDSPFNSATEKLALLRLLAHFPLLKKDRSFKVTSPQSEEYNCIGWAMGTDEWWVAPSEEPGHWWPRGAHRDSRCDSLVEAFACVGFERCADACKEEGYDKVALYKDEQTNEWTHAARVLDGGVSHSKMGASFDIQHSAGNVFQGSLYGVIYAYMKRPKSKRALTADKIHEDEGSIEVLTTTE